MRIYESHNGERKEAFRSRDELPKTKLEQEFLSLIAQIESGKPIENIDLNEFPLVKSVLQQVAQDTAYNLLRHIMIKFCGFKAEDVTNEKLQEMARKAKEKAGEMENTRGVRFARR